MPTKVTIVKRPPAKMIQVRWLDPVTISLINWPHITHVENMRDPHLTHKTIMAWGYDYIVQPKGFDQKWTTPMELYLYLLYNPHERERIRHEINTHWYYRESSIRIYHPCTSEIRLQPHMGDQSFVTQLHCLLKDEGIILKEAKQ
jgi:hypothetical protein